ncbi:MAG TPA: hypothetical protein VIV06_10110 [Candidatus Limnocylindrales bacterium]
MPRIEPEDLLRAGLVLALAVPLGFAFVVVSSSRGLDVYEVGLMLETLGLLIVIITAIVGVGAAILIDRPDVLLGVIALLVGFTIGTNVAVRAIPGDSTDGSFTWQTTAFPSVTGGAVCRWQGQRVTSVASRRTFRYDDQPRPARFSLDVAAGRMIVQLLVPVTLAADSEVVVAGTLQGLAPDGRGGVLNAGDRTLGWLCPGLP